MLLTKRFSRGKLRLQNKKLWINGTTYAVHRFLLVRYITAISGNYQEIDKYCGTEAANGDINYQ